MLTLNWPLLRAPKIAPLFFAAVAVLALSHGSEAWAFSQEATFSRTIQSGAFSQLLQAARTGKLDEFKSLLTGEALKLYGSEEGMHAFLERYNKLMEGNTEAVVNLQTHLNPVIRPDTGLIYTHKAYTVDVMRGEAPVWSISVDCTNFVVIEALASEKNCQIDQISAFERRDGEAESRAFAGVQSHADKLLGGESLAPSEPSPTVGSGSTETLTAGKGL